MRFAAIAVVLLSALSWAQTAPSQADAADCTHLRTPAACEVSARDLKNAREDFQHGLDLQKSGKTQQAFDAFAEAVQLVPKDVEYLTTREVLRQQLVLEHLKAGNALAAMHHDDMAKAEFRQALALDPSNEFAQQRLRDTLPPVMGNLSRFTYIDAPGQLQLAPQTGMHSFHFRGDSRQLIENIAKAYGLAATFDESFQSRQLRFDVDDVTFWRAMQIVSALTRSFFTPVSSHRMLVVADNAQNRAQFERLTERTYYLADATTPQELNDVLNVLRTMFDIRQISHDPGSSSIVVRAPARLLDAATDLLRSIDLARPQVMLDFQVIQINRSMMKDIGLDIPLQWQAFSLSAAALAALNQPDIQAQINQLLNSGGLTAANSSTIASLLQQLQNQQNSISSLLQNPFATFGGGSTRFALPWPPSTLHFSLNTSNATTLEQLSLRAGQGADAVLKIGSRYPVVTATYSSVYNSPAISQVLQNAGATNQNQSTYAPYPSFTFEDLGLNVKAKPQIHQGDVTLDLTVELKSLTGQSFNGVPVISSRTYTGALSVRDGGTVIVAGSLDKSEAKSVSGLPGLTLVPVLNRMGTHSTTQESEGELLILITPHILRRPAETGTAIPVPAF
ncbi:MAG: hypothetical protein ACRD3E_19440 [Terriglobales bacterium]